MYTKNVRVYCHEDECNYEGSVGPGNIPELLTCPKCGKNKLKEDPTPSMLQAKYAQVVEFLKK